MPRPKGARNKKTLQLVAEGKLPPIGVYPSSMSNGVPVGVSSAMPMGPLDIDTGETDKEIWTRLEHRFETIRLMVRNACKGKHRGLFVAGPAGLGKSFTTEEEVAANDPAESRTRYIKGFTRLTGIYRALYDMKDEGSVVIFDDCDSIFDNDDALNLLKCATDTMERRRIYWGAETTMKERDSENTLPTSFDFNGTVIFLTNLDLEALSNTGSKLAPHFRALISRAFYIDCGMHTMRDYLIRIQQVLKLGMLKKKGFSQKEEDEIYNFVVENKKELRELSLRVIHKTALLYREYPTKWRAFAEESLFKNKRLVIETPVKEEPESRQAATA